MGRFTQGGATWFACPGLLSFVLSGLVNWRVRGETWRVGGIEDENEEEDEEEKRVHPPSPGLPPSSRLRRDESARQEVQGPKSKVQDRGSGIEDENEEEDENEKRF